MTIALSQNDVQRVCVSLGLLTILSRTNSYANVADFASAVGIALIVVLSTCSQAAGPRPGGEIELDDLLGKTRTLPGLKDEVDDEKPIVHVSLTPSTAKTSGVVTLSVTAFSLPADAYTYSTSPGMAGATQIAITEAAGLERQGEFEADRGRILIRIRDGQDRREVQSRRHRVRPYVMTAQNPESVRIRGTIEFKYCNRGSCRAFSQPIRAQLINDSPADDAAAEKANPADGFTQVIAPTAVGGRLAPTSLTATLSPRTPHPGDIVTLGVTLNLDGGWHTFSTTQPESIGSTTTQFTLIQGKSLRPLGDAFQPDREPALMAKEADNVGAKEVYYGKVTWTRRASSSSPSPEKPASVSKARFITASVTTANACRRRRKRLSWATCVVPARSCR